MSYERDPEEGSNPASDTDLRSSWPVSEADYTVLLVDTPAPHVRRITLNRPEKRNALNHDLRAQVLHALRAADADPEVRVMIVRGAGSCFSAGYDLGENLRIVAFSVTEGEDKPLKYPTIFNTADAVVLTKMDLCEATEFDEPEARRSIRQVRPGMRVMKVSAKTGEGMADWTAWLEKSREFDKPSSLDVGKSQGT